MAALVPAGTSRLRKTIRSERGATSWPVLQRISFRTGWKHRSTSERFSTWMETTPAPS